MFIDKKLLIVFTAVFILAAVFVSGCGGWVARVNGKTIDEQTFNRRLAEIKVRYGDQAPSEDDGESFTNFCGTITEDLAVRELLHEQADSMGITVSPAEIGQGIEELKKNRFGGDEQKYMQALEAEQISPERASEQLAEGILFLRLKNEITKEAAEPTADEIKIAYEKNPKKYEIAPAVKLRTLLVLSEEEAKAVINRINTGEDMAALAPGLSRDEKTKTKGGDQGWVLKGSMDPALEQSVFTLSPGALSSPVKTESGWVIARVEDTRAPYQRSLEEARDTIKRELSEEAQDNHWEVWLQRIKREAQIEYRDGFQPPKA